MKIHRHKQFKKQYQKLSKVIRDKADQAIIQFSKDPFNSRLKNHTLKGLMQGKRAISVTSTIRIIFEEYADHTVVLMLDIGNHPRVYKM